MYYHASRFRLNRPLLNSTRTFFMINLVSTFGVSVTYLLCYIFYVPGFETLYSLVIFVIILVYLLRSYLYWEVIIQWMAGKEGSEELKVKG